jgi:hypothetical protein
MFEFTSMRLRGTIPHADTRIDFTDGINVIRGLNFSGKSTPFQLFTRLCTGELPYAASKRAKENTGRISVSFIKGNTSYQVTLDLETGKPTIIENGRVLDYRKLPSALAKMEEILPFTLPAFQNFAYLSNDTFPYLLRGTPQQRKLLFEFLFDIDTTAQYKMFQSLDKNMRKLEAKHEALSALSCTPVLQREIKALEKRLDLLEFEYKAMKPKYEAIRAYENARMAWNKYAKSYPNLSKLSDAQLEKRLQTLDPSKLRIEARQAEDYAYYLQIKKEYDTLLQSRADLMRKKLAAVNRKLPNGLTGLQLSKFADLLKANMQRLDSLESPSEVSTEETESALLKAERKLKALAHAKECPLCGTSLAGLAAKKVLHTVEGDLKALDKRLKEQQAQNEAFKAVKHLVIFLDMMDITWADAVYWRDKLTHIERAASEWRLDRDISDIRQNLNNMELIVNNSNKRSLHEIENDLKGCLQERAAIEAFQNFIALEKPEAIDQQDLETLQERIMTMRESLTEKTVQERNYRKLRLEISKLKHRLRIKPVVDSLKHLYGPKGLRLARVRDSVKEYIKNLNLLAPIVFDNYVFSAEMSDTGIDLICKRKTGMSDVRRFSSSEGKLLPLLSLMALHPILPAERRTNLLVLDEVESSMDSATRKLYTRLLTPLQELYPSLWCITPLTKQEFPIDTPDATEYRVSMDSQGRSSIAKVE